MAILPVLTFWVVVQLMDPKRIHRKAKSTNEMERIIVGLTQKGCSLVE
jgi:hypothetical protein